MLKLAKILREKVSLPSIPMRIFIVGLLVIFSASQPLLGYLNPKSVLNDWPLDWFNILIIKRRTLWLSKFLKWSLIPFIIQVFQTILFIFIIIFRTFRSMCPPTFIRCFVSNSMIHSLTLIDVGPLNFLETIIWTLLVQFWLQASMYVLLSLQK